MDFKQLEAFVQVVGLGSFSKAAQKLHLTQPTISAHINSLENELDSLLIIRTPKAALPSDTGKILYEYALSLLSMRDNAMAACKQHKNEISGAISVTASTIPYQHVLPGAMAVFCEKYPKVQFEIISSDSAGSVQDIVDGKAEIGLTGTMIENGKLEYKAFMQDELVVIAPPKEPFLSMKKNAFLPEMVTEYPFITREEGSGTRQEAEEFLKKEGVKASRLQVVAQMDNPDALKRAVSEGVGVSVVSKLSVKDFEKFGMVKVFSLGDKPTLRKLYVVHHKSRPLSLAGAEFVRFLSEYNPNADVAPQTAMRQEDNG